MNNHSAPLPYTQAHDSIGTAPVIANTTLSNTPVPSVQAIEQTIPIPQADQLIRLSHPGGGIFCANIGCTSKGGNCTQRHTKCSDLLCKKCCHNATILAQQLQIDHPPCQECQHHFANAGAPVPNPPQNISAVAAGPAPSTTCGTCYGPTANYCPICSYSCVYTSTEHSRTYTGSTFMPTSNGTACLRSPCAITVRLCYATSYHMAASNTSMAWKPLRSS